MLIWRFASDSDFLRFAVGEEHLGGDGAAEFGLVGGDVVLGGCGFGDLFAEDGGEADDGGGGFGRRLGSLGFSLVG